MPRDLQMNREWLPKEVEEELKGRMKLLVAYLSQKYPELAAVDFSYVGKDPLVLRKALNSSEFSLESPKKLAIFTGLRGTNYTRIAKTSKKQSGNMFEDLLSSCQKLLNDIKDKFPKCVEMKIEQIAFAFPEYMLMGKTKINKKIEDNLALLSNPLLVAAGVIPASACLSASKRFGEQIKVKNIDGFMNMKEMELTKSEEWMKCIDSAVLEKLEPTFVLIRQSLCSTEEIKKE